MNAIVPFSRRKNSTYSNIAYKLKIQSKNLNSNRQVCTCFTFCHQRNSQTNTREYSIRSDRTKNWLVLCCSWDLICLPLTDINGWEEATQKNTYGCMEKWTSANKRCTTCRELWQLIKAHVPKVAVINYAEGSIVRFCLLLLLQIIERFKNVVGGRSCRLSFLFLPPLLNLCHGCVWLLEHI